MPKKGIGHELRALNNLVMRFMKNYSHKKSVDNMTGTNAWIIGYIAENSDRNVYQRDLEEEFSITRSTASKVVNLMVKKGLIERQGVPHDARLKKLVLTDDAIKISKLMEEDGKNLEKKLTEGFTEEELCDLYSFFDRMKKNMT